MNKEDIFNRLKDPKFYLENFTKIKGKKAGSLIPFILNEAQKDLFNTLRKHDRVVILKARQLGFSTGITGYFYHNTIITPGTTTALIGYNAELTTELLDKIKTFYSTTPDEMKPTIHYNSKYEISFPKMNSKILVLPSTETVGRGYTLSNVLATELAFWDKPEEKMIALEAAVPIGGKLVVESTPNMIGDLFHRMWMDDKNDYVKKEYSYRWGYTEEEFETIRRRMNDPIRFEREYGLSFISSGRSAFDQKIIQNQRKNIIEADKAETIDGLRIYKKVSNGDYVVIGVDVGEGLVGGDYSVATFWNRKTGEEMAMYRGLIPPDRFGEKLNRWGRQFNNALMVVEVNNHGLTTVTALKNLNYPSLYFRPSKFEMPGNPTSNKLGWKTTKMTRPLLIDDFAQAVRDESLIVHSKELLDEMMVLTYNDNGDMTSPRGFHDDCLFSAAIAFQGFKVMYDKPLDQLNYEEFLPKNFAY